jgi:hypothetical protein
MEVPNVAVGDDGRGESEPAGWGTPYRWGARGGGGRVMNRVKVRCSVCGRPFKTPLAKKTVCPACEAEAKRAKHRAERPQVEKPVAGTTSSVDVRAALRAAQENQGQYGAYRPPAPVTAPPAESPQTGKPGSNGLILGRQPGPSTEGKPRPRREAQPRPPKARTAKPRISQKPFEPSPEQATAIRERYLALARPEFDGVRHQIATEMGIPLRAVKNVIKMARDDEQVQSWWERSGGAISAEDIELIKTLYVPYLPDPDIGVHKQIASQLHLTNTSVYLAIGRIRTDMQLPRYLPREGLPGDVDGAIGGESTAVESSASPLVTELDSTGNDTAAPIGSAPDVHQGATQPQELEKVGGPAEAPSDKAAPA